MSEEPPLIQQIYNRPGRAQAQSVPPPPPARLAQPVQSVPLAQRKRRVRKMTIVLWVWTILMAAWVIGGSISAQKGCDANYQGACDAGTAIGVGLIIGLWFMGFVVLSLIWFMTKPKD